MGSRLSVPLGHWGTFVCPIQTICWQLVGAEAEMGSSVSPRPQREEAGAGNDFWVGGEAARTRDLALKV